jgi:hypothetical protein
VIGNQYHSGFVREWTLLNCSPDLTDDRVHMLKHVKVRLIVVNVMSDMIEVFHHQIEVTIPRVVQVR